MPTWGLDRRTTPGVDQGESQLRQDVWAVGGGWTGAEGWEASSMAKSTRLFDYSVNAMIPEPYELFDFEKGSDKLFFIGTTWIVLFLFLL